jgi:hypothetical protein
VRLSSIVKKSRTGQIPRKRDLGSREGTAAGSLERVTAYLKECAQCLNSRFGRPCKLERCIGNTRRPYRKIGRLRFESGPHSYRPGISNEQSPTRKLPPPLAASPLTWEVTWACSRLPESDLLAENDLDFVFTM